MENKKLINKIRNLFNLASSKDYNPQEASSALMKAKDLMQKHQISESDLEVLEIVENQTFANNGRAVKSYYVNLIVGISRLYNCKALTTTRYKKTSSKAKYEVVVRFIGTELNSELATYCFEALKIRLDYARKMYMKKSKQGVRGGDAFACGWSQEVSTMVTKMLDDLNKVQGNNTCKEHPQYGLVKADTAIANYMEGLTFTKSRKRTITIYNSTAYDMGKSEGAKVNLNKGVHQKSSNLVLK